MKWHYASSGRSCGPVEESELSQMAKDGRLKPSDLVWNETMGGQWTPASSVPGLFDAAEPAPAQAPAPGPVFRQERASERKISCVTPVMPAWERMMHILFGPFQIGKWFLLGFSAWLASFVSGAAYGGGGCQGRFSSPFRGMSGVPGGGPGKPPDIGEFIDQAQSFLRQHGALVLGITLGVIVVGYALGLVCLWLGSRGQFMLLDNVVHNRTEIGKPWKDFRRHGNSLFLWQVVFGLACMAVFLLFAVLGFWAVVLPCIKARTLLPSVLPALVALFLLYLPILIVTGVIMKFLHGFVVPIMYRFDCTATEGWRRFAGIFKGNFWRFVLYLLFGFVLQLAAGICAVVFCLATCCIGWLLLLIPYIGAVVSLPLSVFFRSYRVEYLAQFGPEYVLFPARAPDSDW